MMFRRLIYSIRDNRCAFSIFPIAQSNYIIGPLSGLFSHFTLLQESIYPTNSPILIIQVAFPVDRTIFTG